MVRFDIWQPTSDDKVDHQHMRRVTMSSIFRAIATFLTMLALTTQILFPSEAAETRCDDASPKLRALQEALYHYAVLAEIPYRDKHESTKISPQEKSCKLERTGKRLRPADPKSIRETAKLDDMLVRLLRSQGDAGSDDRLNKEISEYKATLNMDRGERRNWQYIAIDDRNDVTYIGCRHDTKTPRLYVTWDEMTVSDIPIIFVDGNHIIVQQQRATLIIPQIYVAVTDQEGHPNTIRQGIEWEELGLVKLKPIDKNSAVDSVLAIRGTDFENLSTVVTSMKDVLAESCAFESTAVIVKVMASRIAQTENTEQPKTEIIVTGHSLGGAATQYIGQSNIGPSRYTMRGYAFNAMGIDDSQSSYGNKSSTLLYSQYVHGDPVSLGGKLLGRIQPGTVLVSKPPSNLPNWLSDLWIDPLHRHKLDTVQKVLCQCLNGQGRIVEK